jgi:broad specificity phosphatase PhoE
MGIVYFVRHAKPDNPKRLVGHDGVISAEGRLELAQLSRFFSGKNFERVFHSPLRRAMNTNHQRANPGKNLKLEPPNSGTKK